MNVLIVDTSTWIEYFKGKAKDDLDLALQESRVYLPPLVVAELLSGKMPSDKRKQLSDFLRELPLCKIDFEHWARVGLLRNKLLSAGYSISTPDVHVARCALDLNGYLVSEDFIFSKIAKSISLKLLT